MSISENVQIDEASQTITIYGIRYSIEVFRGLGLTMPLFSRFQLEKREDGVITIRRVSGTVYLQDEPRGEHPDW